VLCFNNRYGSCSVKLAFNQVIVYSIFLVEDLHYLEGT